MAILIRDASERDIPEILEVRTSVRENHSSTEQMSEIGITCQTILEALQNEPCIWVAVAGHHIVGFAMGSSKDASLLPTSSDQSGKGNALSAFWWSGQNPSFSKVVCRSGRVQTATHGLQGSTQSRMEADKDSEG